VETEVFREIGPGGLLGAPAPIDLVAVDGYESDISTRYFISFSLFVFHGSNVVDADAPAQRGCRYSATLLRCAWVL
jgi:hypothetical protein